MIKYGVIAPRSFYAAAAMAICEDFQDFGELHDELSDWWLGCLAERNPVTLDTANGKRDWTRWASKDGNPICSELPELPI